MKKLGLIFLIAAIVYPISVFANLTISSYHVLFDAGSPRRSEVVRVTNSGSTEKSYRIKMVNFRQMPDGTYQPIDEPISGNPFASPYIGFSPHETTLKPGQSQTVRLVRKAMAAAPVGEYVSHLMVQEMPEKRQVSEAGRENGIKINIRALYGVTIPVIIDKGDLKSSGIIEKSTLVRNGKLSYVEVTVKRSGSRSFWGTLIIKENNKEIGRINAFKIFMTTLSRRIKVPLTHNPTGKISVTLQDARTDALISTRNI